MDINRIHWKIGGSAGQGIKSSGLIFAKACTRGGLNAFGYTEYPSLIKGGHNTYQVRVEEKPVLTLIKNIDMLVALDKKSIFLHKDEMAHGGVIIYDADRVKVDMQQFGRDDVRLIHVPALKISQALKVSELMENQVFLGATFAFLDYDFEILKGVITDEYIHKGEEIVRKDLAAAKAGYDFAKEHCSCHEFPKKLVPKQDKEKLMVLTGNDALSLGAVKAGCKFYAAYPMTPASSILHTMAALQEEYGMVVKHAEDEISVVNMTIGAGFAGVRAMCGTSGGGFALMGEGYSLAAMTETPLVMVEAMRGGPATGIPTWTEQGDLKFVLNAGHGEFPRFVLTPGDPEEAFYLTAEAFNIAETYQTPVVVITDKHLAESHWSYPFFNKDVSIERGDWVTNDELKELANKGKRFRRYSWDTENGVSKRVRPGQHKNGIFLANSDEHDEFGYSSEEIDVRNKMFGKRKKKAATYAKVMPTPNVYGPKDADITVVCWGSTKTMALQAMEWFNAENKKQMQVYHFTHVSPFPKDSVKEFLSNAKHILNVEHNKGAQMAEVIRGNTSIEIKHHLLKNDGRPIFPEEILAKVKSILEGDDQ